MESTRRTRSVCLLFPLLLLVLFSTAASATVDSWVKFYSGGVYSVGTMPSPTPGAPGIVFVATDNGLLRSLDDGVSWTVVQAQCRGRIAPVQSIPGMLYVGAAGYLLKSTDYGSSWSTIGAGGVSLAHPTDPNILYWGTNKSVDGGLSWYPMQGLPSVQILRICIADPTVLVAYTSGVSYRSIDGGDHWSLFSGGKDDSIEVDPTDSRYIYKGGCNDGETIRYYPGGSNTMSTLGGQVHAFAVDPSSHNRVYAVHDSGSVYRSVDFGATWAPYGGTSFSITEGNMLFDRTMGRLYILGPSRLGTGGDGLWKVDTIPPDAGTAPTVTSASPPPGGFISILSTVSATFSEDMDAATLSPGSFTVSQFVGVRTLAQGSKHTVALKNDNTVAAWGDNASGECNVPAGLGGVVAVAAGGTDFSAALKSDGTVAAWGNNGFGQINVPLGLAGVIDIAAGYAHMVALKGDGTVVAWGDNSAGQCRVPTGLTGVAAVTAGYQHTVALKRDGTVVVWGNIANAPSGLNGVVDVSSGYAHSVALKADNTVVAWGDNRYGQATVPPGLSGIVAIAAGAWHTVALKSDGTLVAWGANDNGQITVPPGLGSVDFVAAGLGATLAIRADNTVVAWGYNEYAQNNAPALVSRMDDISVGSHHRVARRNDGTVLAWGANEFGQSTVPAGLSGVVAASAGKNHSVAVKGDGTMAAWGSNGNGECNIPTNLSGVIDAAAGVNFTVALKNDNTVVAWGVNDYGQSTVPAGLTGVTAISAGLTHTAALTQDGNVVVWGGNTNGELIVPSGATGLVSVSAGAYHTVALKKDGTVIAWGGNASGQSTVPAGLSGVVAVAAGDAHTLALKRNGTVVAWGANALAVPAGLSGVVAISAGYGYSMALKADGTAVSWGAWPAISAPVNAYETAVPGTVTSSYTTATFTPVALLAPSTTYKATLNTIARSEYGMSLASDVTWSFSTNTNLNPPVSTIVSPAKNAEFFAYTVTVSGTATDQNGSGVARVQISLDDGNHWYYTATGTTAWSYTFNVRPGGGAYAVRSRAIDGAGNVEMLTPSVTFTIDNQGPVGTIVINGGAGYTNSTAATLTLSATDISGVTQMQFSNDGSTWNDDGTWSAPEPYNTTKSWTLAAGDGSKTVYVRYMDGLGTWSYENYAFIVIDTVIDTVAPVATATDPVAGTNGVPVTQVITITFSEPVQPGTKFGNIKLVKGSTNVAVTNVAAGVLTITPNTALAKNTKYTVTIPTGAVMDMAGNASTKVTSLTFTTTK